MKVANSNDGEFSFSTRREFPAASVGAVAGLSGIADSVAAESPTAPSRLPGDSRDWSKVHGFNYQPSYGRNGLELWQKFDAGIIEAELTRGKKYFPGINALRWWQSWDAFQGDPKGYVKNFAATLRLAEQFGCVVMPVLFNRWHSTSVDYGGIYIDHFLTGSYIANPQRFDAYLEALVGPHTDDPRILAWDLCNEPYFYSQGYLPPGATAHEIAKVPRVSSFVVEAEAAWLRRIHDKCKTLQSKAPLTVGTHPLMPLEQAESISDVLSIHPYWIPELQKHQSDYERTLDAHVALARKVNKPLIATECCWGALQDRARAELVRHTLTQLKKRGIGYLAYLLNHSLIADAHRAEYGPVEGVGTLAFIEADGSLRPDHEVFNELQ